MAFSDNPLDGDMFKVNQINHTRALPWCLLVNSTQLRYRENVHWSTVFLLFLTGICPLGPAVK